MGIAGLEDGVDQNWGRILAGAARHKHPAAAHGAAGVSGAVHREPGSSAAAVPADVF